MPVERAIDQRAARRRRTRAFRRHHEKLLGHKMTGRQWVRLRRTLAEQVKRGQRA